MTLTTFFEATYSPLRLVGCSNHHQYAVQIRHLRRFLEREPELSDFHDDTLTRFLGWLGSGRSAATVNKARTHLLALWRFAARKKLVAEYPDVVKIKEPERIPRAWTVEQVKILLAATTLMHGRYGSIPAPDWWQAFLRVLFDSGERASATLAMRWSWIDLDSGRVTIPAEYRKGKVKDASYILRTAAMEALRKIRGPGEDVFPWPLCRASFFLHFGKLLRRAKLPSDRRSKSQKMRRTFASHLESAGGNATQALQHSSRSVTERSYLDPAIVGRVAPSSLLPEV